MPHGSHAETELDRESLPGQGDPAPDVAHIKALPPLYAAFLGRLRARGVFQRLLKSRQNFAARLFALLVSIDLRRRRSCGMFQRSRAAFAATMRSTKLDPINKRKFEMFRLNAGVTFVTPLISFRSARMAGAWRGNGTLCSRRVSIRVRGMIAYRSIYPQWPRLQASPKHAGGPRGRGNR
jgi:hypothetical protein